MPNKYINTHLRNEQDMIASLVDEAIRMHAERFFYIPRKLVFDDSLEILGENRLSRFEQAYPFDGYLENTTAFEGQGFFIQKFGGVVDYSAVITISKQEWEKAIGRFGNTIIPNRPAEGDLIYYEASDGLFEIKFVDDKNPFAQLGKFYSFKLTVELFQYNSEQIDTQLPDIDVFESLKTFDQNPDRSLWGGVDSVKIINPGKGYIQPPTITIESLTGNQAEFSVALNDDGSIKSIAIINPGMMYHSTDQIKVIGNLKEGGVPAELSVVIKTQIENTGDRFGSNQALIEVNAENANNAADLFGTDPDLYNNLGDLDNP